MPRGASAVSVLSARPPGASGKNDTFASILRQTQWLLSTTYISEFGPLSTQLFGLVYFSWLLYLTFRATGTDYMHLTKAFGHVAVSQLPMHYLLAVKAPNSPLTRATGLTHERLNAVHRLFGRMIHVLLAVHAVLYIFFFARLGILAKRVRDRDVRLGLAAFWAVNALGLLAVPAIRRRVKWYYSVFYRSHVLLSALVLPLVYFHVPYTRVYVMQAGVFWVLGGVVRRWGSEWVGEVRCEVVAGKRIDSGRRTAVGTGSGAGTEPGKRKGIDAEKKGRESEQLISVRFRVRRWSPLAHATPGQHVYLRRGRLLGPKNPFTIANVRAVVEKSEEEDEKGEAVRLVEKSGEKVSKGKAVEVQLVLRNTGGPQTSWLAGLARVKPAAKGETNGSIRESDDHTTKRTSSVVSLQIEGPYGESAIYLPQLLDERKHGGPILLVAGGVGATYTLPIFTALLAANNKKGTMTGPHEAAGRGRKIMMVWLVKTLDEAQWGLTNVTEAQERDGIEVEAVDLGVYVTRENSSTGKKADANETTDHVPAIRTESEAGVGVRVHYLGHRPDLDSILNNALLSAAVELGNGSSNGLSPFNKADPHEASRAEDPVTVFLCGPSSLVKDVRTILGKHVRQGRDVRVFEEVFGFGGS